MATTPKKPATPKAKAAPAPKAAVKPAATAKKAAPVAPKPVVAVEAPQPVPVIIAEPAPAPAKLTLVASAPAAAPVKTLDTAGVMKGYEDLTLIGKDSFDALVKANALFAKGLEDFGKEVLSIAQAHIAEAAKLTKAMLLARTLHEVVEMHTTLTKTSIEKLVAESSMLSELGMKVTNEAIAPISAQVTKAVEKIRELAAA